ncbi:MAG TPA: hypothetical protein VFR86_11305, partial [Burkholderiaceae bacterium]|nr:hypothetical protein [Burkholderiaceae bacterium]
MIGWLTARLQRRLSIALALVIVPPTLIIAFYAVTQTGRVLIDAARMERLRLVTARTAVAERMLSDTAADVLFLSQAPAVRRFVNAASGAARAQALADIERHFVAFLGRWTSRYADACLLDERGRETLCVRVTDGRPAVVPAHGLADRSAESYFTGALSLLAIPGQLPVHVAELELQPAGRAFAQPLVPTLRYTTPLQTDAGLLAGALALNALVGRVLQAVETGDPPQEGAATYVVDRSGYYIAHPQPERRFGNLLGSGYTLYADRPNDAAVLLGGRAGTLLQSADRPDALQAYAHIRPSGQSRVVWT